LIRVRCDRAGERDHERDRDRGEMTARQLEAVHGAALRRDDLDEDRVVGEADGRPGGEHLGDRVRDIAATPQAVVDHLHELLARGGVFAGIRDDRHLFRQVRVKPDSRTIEWPGEVDLDPDVLYGTFEPASGIRITRRVVRAPAHA